MASKTDVKRILLAKCHCFSVLDERLKAIGHAFSKVVENGVSHKFIVVFLDK
jgi:hypothetical protein